MQLTPYHAKYLAYELTRRCASDSLEKLTAVLSDAQVDLNPHQVEAALFAFRNPLSKGAILADEVGLGKTIEAGLLIAQKWAERKRRILIIVPANLRKQWSQELADKFFLNSVILENRTFNETIKTGNLNPFEQPAIVICSYQFASRMQHYVRQTPWDLVVVDEAHRLRNVYKPTNKIANAIKHAIAPYRKVLLTATPLQNSLLELFGLVSIIDEFTFGDLAAFRSRFVKLANAEDFQELKERLKPVCKRTLRKQVLEYIKYTNRHPLVQEFYPNDDEQKLYDLVSDYLQQDNLYALPRSQRKLMTLILRKLLGSSTYAISDTLNGLANKLDSAIQRCVPVAAPPEDLAENYEEYPELDDEWDGDETGADEDEPEVHTQDQIVEMREEMAKLREFHELAKSIASNSKGDVLLTALRRGFKAAAEAQQGQPKSARLQQKAIIFTESRKTQEYLLRILNETEFAGKVVLFNGTNSDPRSKQIYKDWVAVHQGTDKISGSPGADMRAALVDYFRNSASIMIATEAAAEGINLQFCNLVVNYDLPWNPQRVEQRIGRCHRYGQQFDVIVVNFLNKKNAADERIYKLLADKFKLFNGVFGASDEVLGVVESGVDFEKRIADICQKCRTPVQIQFEFDQLQQELDTEIVTTQRDAREKLLDNFDQEVIEKVRINTAEILDRFQARLWELTQYLLKDYAEFDPREFLFRLYQNPFAGETIHPGPYRLGKQTADANSYRVGHPLAERILAQAKCLATESVELRFDYGASGKNITALQSLRGKSGWLRCSLLSVNAIETQDAMLLAAFADDGTSLDIDQSRRLFDLVGTVADACEISSPVDSQLSHETTRQQSVLLADIAAKNGEWFDKEMDKLDHWADDLKQGIERDIKDLEQEIRAKKKEARMAAVLEEKVAGQKAVKDLERKLKDKRKHRDEAQDEIEARKDRLIEDIEVQLKQQSQVVSLFTIRWKVS